MAAQKTAPGSCGTVSASHQHRLDGNELYSRAKADGLAPAVQRLRYEESLVCFNRALRCASNDVEKSSAHKNIALANLRLAQMAVRQNSAYASEAGKDGRVDKVNLAELYRWEQALSSFEQARDCRVRCCDDLGKWMESLIQMWWSCLEDLRQICLTHAYRQRLEFLQRLQTNVGQDKIVVWQMLQLFLCNIKFNESVRCREGDHFQSAIASAQSCLQDVNQLLDSCERYSNKFSLFVGHCDLYDDLHNVVAGLAVRSEQQERICRAMQSCAVGDIVLDKALNANEGLGIELVWEAVDHFQQSLILARDQEVEQEAIAYARLTKVFGRVLLSPDKAETYGNRTATLAEALMPRNLHNEEWYRTAMAILERIRHEKAMVDAKAEAEELQQYKDQLKEDLEALAEQDQGTSQQVLVHIYTNHPPKNYPEYKLPDHISGDDLKKLFRMALLHYHPDKVKKDDDGMKWYVLCNEITKILNRRYTQVK